MIPEIEITVKLKNKPEQLRKFSNSKDAYEVLNEIYQADNFEWQEVFIMVCLNRANKMIGFYKVSRGGVSGTVVDPKIIFTTCLNTPGTTSIIISHNHPSGNPLPSEADITITKKLRDGGRLLDIAVLDHIIFTDTEYYSFADRGEM